MLIGCGELIAWITYHTVFSWKTAAKWRMKKKKKKKWKEWEKLDTEWGEEVRYCIQVFPRKLIKHINWRLTLMLPQSNLAGPALVDAKVASHQRTLKKVWWQQVSLCVPSDDIILIIITITIIIAAVMISLLDKCRFSFWLLSNQKDVTTTTCYIDLSCSICLLDIQPIWFCSFPSSSSCCSSQCCFRLTRKSLRVE